jgi:hypothetical protein
VSPTPARLVHRYAIRLSDRQLDQLRRTADACDVPISVLLRVAIRWVIAAGPAVLDGIGPVVTPPQSLAHPPSAGLPGSRSMADESSNSGGSR